MVKIANPAKGFYYSIEIPGVDANAVMQKVMVGEFEIEKIEHGDGNHLIPTWGQAKVPDVVLEKMIPEDGPDGFWWSRYRAQVNTTSGNSGLPSDEKFSYVIKLKNGAGATVRAWQANGAGVFKFKQGDLGDKENDNIIDTVTLCQGDLFALII